MVMPPDVMWCGVMWLLQRDMTSLKGKIKVMEEEKERLGEKVERAKGQVRARARGRAE